MYRDYYGFRDKPFTITPDPGFIFLSEHHNEAFAHLLYGIEHHVGFIALTGEIGAGKTTVIRTLLGQLAPDRYRTAFIFNPCLSSLGLMQTINREYGLPADHADTADLLLVLNRFLLEENAAGRTVALVVDEAQNLGSAVLEQIRLISNLETERDKLIQIVLVGQPELRKILSQPELRQLGQRIGVSYHLSPMNLTDTRDYIAHRIAVAGRLDTNLFTAGAVRRIYRFSDGLPRLINLACDRALLLGYTRERTPITAGMAGTALADLRLTARGGGTRRMFLYAGIALCVAALLGVGLSTINRQQTPQPEPRRPPLSVSTLTRELVTVHEKKNALAVFNVIAGLWRLPLATDTSTQSYIPEALARERGLDILRFTGNLGTLLRYNSPAILELSLPGGAGKRYLALTGGGAHRYTIAPPLAGWTTLSRAELDGIWSGRAYLPWKNHLDIPPGLKVGAQGIAVTRLQELLRNTALYRNRISGVFDRPTHDAVRSFQIARGIQPDGTVGRQTLFLLYRADATFTNPSLTHDDGGER